VDQDSGAAFCSLRLIWLAESTADWFFFERKTLLAGWLIWLIISSEQAGTPCCCSSDLIIMTNAEFQDGRIQMT
jgi:hypothetical protein